MYFKAEHGSCSRRIECLCSENLNRLLKLGVDKGLESAARRRQKTHHKQYRRRREGRGCHVPAGRLSQLSGANRQPLSDGQTAHRASRQRQPGRRADPLESQDRRRSGGKAGEEGPEHLQHLLEAGRPEDDKPQAHHQQGVEMGQKPAGSGPLKPLAVNGPAALQGGEHAVPDSPEHEGSAGPVPEAAQQEHQGLIQRLACLALAVSAQRDVEVIPEPGGQGDVPAPPEVRNGGSYVGVPEVLRRLKAKHAAQADGHVAVAREIKVDLNRIGRSPQPGHADVQRAAQGKGAVHNGGHGARNQHLLAKAHDEPAQAPGRPLAVKGAAEQLGREMVKAGNGAGGDLGEKGDVQQHVQKAPGRPAAVPVGVHHIGHGFEDKKGDAHRQKQVCLRNIHRQNPVQNTGKKVQIFKAPQQSQVQHDRQYRRRLFD